MLKKTCALIIVLLTLIAPLNTTYGDTLLRNGERVPTDVLMKTFMTINSFLKEDVWSLLYLIDIAKDPDYELTSIVEEWLTKLEMIEHGKMDSTVRTIILSFVEGEGTEMKIVNPVQPEKGQEDSEAANSVVYIKDLIKKKLEL